LSSAIDPEVVHFHIITASASEAIRAARIRRAQGDDFASPCQK